MDFQEVVNKVKKFATLADNIELPDNPKLPSDSDRNLIRNLLIEELEETLEEDFENDFSHLINRTDGLGDLLFVVVFACLNQGVCPMRLLNVIADSNLTKFREGYYKRKSDNKIIKSPLYDPVDIPKFLDELTRETLTEIKIDSSLDGPGERFANTVNTLGEREDMARLEGRPTEQENE